MKTLIRYFAKKYVASVVTDMLQKASQKINLDIWKQRVRGVLDFCQMLLDKLADNVITNEEAREIAEKAKSLVK